MAALVILICLSIIMAAGFLGVFIWSVMDGQMDDNYSPSVRILYDDAPPVSKFVS